LFERKKQLTRRFQKRKEPPLLFQPSCAIFDFMVSARNLPADIRTWLEAGAFIYLTKPVDCLDLKQSSKKVLGA